MTSPPADFDTYTRRLRGDDAYRDNAHRRSMPGPTAQLARFLQREARRERDPLPGPEAA